MAGIIAMGVTVNECKQELNTTICGYHQIPSSNRIVVTIGFPVVILTQGYCIYVTYSMNLLDFEISFRLDLIQYSVAVHFCRMFS